MFVPLFRSGAVPAGGRRLLALTAMVTVLLFIPVLSYGFAGKGEDCSKCHTLKKDEAAELIKKLIPNAQILDIRVAPLKSMWEVSLESGGKKGILYIDFTKKFLVSGAIRSMGSGANLTEERMVDLNKVDPSKIPVKDALLLGEKTARHKVIVFDDPD